MHQTMTVVKNVKTISILLDAWYHDATDEDICEIYNASLSQVEYQFLTVMMIGICSSWAIGNIFLG
jgi:DNA-binding protein Fis